MLVLPIKKKWFDMIASEKRKKSIEKLKNIIIKDLVNCFLIIIT